MPTRISDIQTQNWQPRTAPSYAPPSEDTLAWQRELDAERLSARVKLCGVPKRFLGKDFTAFSPQCVGSRNALETFQGYTEHFHDTKRRGACLVGVGAPGTGKTHLACAVAMAVTYQGFTALYTTQYDLLSSIKATYDRNSDEDTRRAVRRYVTPDLLVLDEVDAVSEHEDRILFDILNQRYNDGERPVILLANGDKDSLFGTGTKQGILNARIADRLREGSGDLVLFSWKSHRGAS